MSKTNFPTSGDKKKYGSESPSLNFEDDSIQNTNNISKKQTGFTNDDKCVSQEGNMEWKPKIFRHGMEHKEPEENKMNYKITISNTTTTNSNTMSSPLYPTADTCSGFPFGGAFCG